MPHNRQRLKEQLTDDWTQLRHFNKSTQVQNKSKMEKRVKNNNNNIDHEDRFEKTNKQVLCFASLPAPCWVVL